MYKHTAFCLAVLIVFSVTAQTINIHGTVTNKAGKAIPNAILTLALQDLKDTTGSDGAFSISKSLVGILQPIAPPIGKITMNKGILEITLSYPSPVKVEIFDTKGNLLKKEIMQKAPAGIYRMNVGQHSLTATLLVINATVDDHSMCFRYLPLNNNLFTIYSSFNGATPFSGGFAKIAAVVDTLKASAEGYTSKAVPITSLDTTVDITLESTSVSSDTGRSAGCGKALSDLKSGTHTITSAGLSREYIIDIPADYDPDKPYRLIFAMHWFGGSMQQVANEQFFSLKSFANNDNVPCIWVAPNGTGSTRGWDLGEQDHAFFDDMYNLFTEKLCVDTKRVFSCGFSFGALFTYALSLSHQKQLRAVACYSPANWNIYLPENTHEPIAFYATTGTNEPNTKFIKDETQRLGVKYCVLDHAADNGCDTNITIPQATSATHVSTEFEGCDEYPVKFGSFQGQLSYAQKDPGSSVNWIAAETWEFFMRF